MDTESKLGDVEKYILDFLNDVYPHGRTIRELQRFADLYDCNANEVKSTLKRLRNRGLVEYIDPTGWKLITPVTGD